MTSAALMKSDGAATLMPTQARAAMMPNEVIREAYESGPYYSHKDTGELFAEEDNTTGRMEGQVESSSGEDCYSADEKNSTQSPSRSDDFEDGRHYTTLESVDAKYLSRFTDNIYRNVAQEINVIEFKDTVQAQPYNLNTINSYYHHQDSPSAPQINGHVSETPVPVYLPEMQQFKNENYTDVPKETSPCREILCAPYQFHPGVNVNKSRESSSPYGYPLPVVSQPPDNWSSYGNPVRQLPKAAVFLCNRELWSKFHTHTTEMIVTKQGRRMFPVLEFSFTGLDKNRIYNVYIDMILADQNRLKFQNGQWIPVGETEQLPKTGRIYLHPDSPNTGSHWMKQDIVFNKLKLTNNKKNSGGHIPPTEWDSGHTLKVKRKPEPSVKITEKNPKLKIQKGEVTICVSSMHKYQPRMYVIEVGPCKTGDPKNLQTHFFPETKFITVTAYQNTDITQLKIDHNPFAKGFRDTQEGNAQMYSGYPQIGQSHSDIFNQTAYGRFSGHPLPSYSPEESTVKTEIDSAPQSHYTNGSFQLTFDEVKPHGYYLPPHHASSVYSASGSSSSSDGQYPQHWLPPPPAYNQFQLTPPYSKEEGFEPRSGDGQVYWNSSDQSADEQYECDQPSKRARYSSEDFSS